MYCMRLRHLRAPRPHYARATAANGNQCTLGWTATGGETLHKSELAYVLDAVRAQQRHGGLSCVHDGRVKWGA